MTINEYQKEALKTEKEMKRYAANTKMEKAIHKLYPRLFNALMGVNDEVGEAIDLLKEHIFSRLLYQEDCELDKEHMAKELGDVALYLAVGANAIGYDLETVLKMSIDCKQSDI